MATLFRQEYELKKPKNWGKIAFDAIQKRTQELKESRPLAPKESVRAALENQPVVSGPLDASEIIHTLPDTAVCEFLCSYPKCESLTLKNWTKISGSILRSVSITMGETLTELDMSNTKIVAAELEIVIAHSSKLKILKFANCERFDSSCVSTIAKLASSTVQELHVPNCPLLRIDPLLCIGGCVGVGQHALYKLRTLNLAGCPVQDPGLLGVAHGCKHIRYLNLEGCTDLSDSSVCAMVQASKGLQLLNVCALPNITDKVVLALAAGCPKLFSLNISKCGSITDSAMSVLARGCPLLQALNLSGLSDLTEATMYELAHNCPGILMLNMSGCSSITINGLKAIVAGLKYVKMSLSFIGFLPVDDHVALKLTNHIEMLRDNAVEHIRTGLAKRAKKEQMKDKHLKFIRNKAASTIQAYMFRYTRRMRFYQLWRFRVRRDSTIFLQKRMRGFLARRLRDRLRRERDKFLSNTPYALKIQQTVRGHLSRTRSEHIFVMLREMYINRRREAQAAIATRLQAVARRFLSSRRMGAWRDVRYRRLWDERVAATRIQQLARKFISIIYVQGLRFQKQRKDEREFRAAQMIQRFYTSAMTRYLNKMDGKEILKVQHRRVKSTLLLQRAYRGFAGRERAYKFRIVQAARNHAAINIQRIFRGQRVLRWKDIRNNSIAAFVLDRHYLERMVSLENSRLRYQNYIVENRRDSASDPDDEYQDKQWTEMYDHARKRKYWYSENTHEITYDEPRVPVAHEQSMIGLRVRVYWVVQGAWYEGTISRFHRRTHRHRIEYDDTDHEWIDFDTEYDRIQIQTETGSWMMYLVFTSEGKNEDNRIIENAASQEAFRKQAMIDAGQWEPVKDDYNGSVVFMSNLTGEIRIGCHGCQEWVVQDDGYGMPCFYNVNDASVEYEDPRFIHDADLELIAKRGYVMDELRYALYFCREFWERYEKAVNDNNEKEKRVLYVQVYKSSKPKQLNSWVLRARGLFTSVSVVDVPLNVNEKQELEYSAWLVARMHELAEKGQDLLTEKKEVKAKVVTEIVGKAKTTIKCHYCGRDAKRNLDFCPTCGHRLI